MISFSASGNTNRTDAFLDAMISGRPFRRLDSLAQRGVDALAAATPRDSGLTASSWTYEITETAGAVTIYWNNTNVINGFHVAIGLQYGHGTGTGGWVEGYDYINPALRPIFDEIANSMWREVQNA